MPNPTLSPAALADLEAGGAPPAPDIPVDPVALTPWATQAILALVKYATSYSGQVTVASPYIVAAPPTWQDGPRWLKGATRHLALMAGVELDADGMATVDGWIVTVSVGGAS